MLSRIPRATEDPHSHPSAANAGRLEKKQEFAATSMPFGPHRISVACGPGICDDVPTREEQVRDTVESERCCMSNASDRALYKDVPTDPSLLQRVQKREADAGNRFVELYGPLLTYWARRGGVPDQELADHVQNVFVAVLKAMPAFSKDRPQGGSFRGWLLKISGNFVADYFRRKRKRPEVPLPDEAVSEAELSRLAAEENSSSPPSRRILAERIQQVMERDFEPKTLEAFRLLTIDELDAGAVAVRLQMTPHAVRKAKSRVLQRLRTEFGDLAPWQ
jgi:RNA polymerase sigma-70 factor, ECF subfamily